MLKVAVLISGRGSNLQSLIDACQQPGFPAEIIRVIANRPGAKGLARAERAGIATTIIDHRDHSDKASFDAALDKDLRDHGAQLVCLAGFMRILTPNFVAAWRDRLINIHPSLLPSFKGLDAQQSALDAGVRITGCTVHFVRAQMDSGPIIAQAAVPVLPGDDAHTLSARILTQEHIIYPQALELIARGRVRIEGNRAIIAAPGG
jgi:phosphoribosylglycinamide formyltransferase-1